jgi:hypothetical protein
MLCATGAVACLAIFNVQWSRELPVLNHWEPDLFGDLTFPSVPVTREDSAEPTTLSAPPLLKSGIENPILGEHVPGPTQDGHPPQLEHDSFHHQLPAWRARFIQPVQHENKHQPPDAAPTVWLSGGIELLSDDSAPANLPDVQYFPDAHPDTTSRPGSG